MTNECAVSDGQCVSERAVGGGSVVEHPSRRALVQILAVALIAVSLAPSTDLVEVRVRVLHLLQLVLADAGLLLLDEREAVLTSSGRMRLLGLREGMKYESDKGTEKKKNE